MTEENLIKANEIKEELRELDCFMWSAEHVWTGKIIKRDSIYIFKSNAYGIIDSVEYNMNTKIKNKVLSVLREYLSDLKGQLESI